MSLLDLEFSSDEEYNFEVKETGTKASSINSNSDDNLADVPLLEVSPTTGSLRSLSLSTTHESFQQYRPGKKCKKEKNHKKTTK